MSAIGRSGRAVRALAAAALAALALGVLASSAAAQDDEPLVRKDVTTLSAEERAELVAALKALKSTPSPYDDSLSWYDQFVEWHVFLTDCSPLDPFLFNNMRGHAGPMFLPWHRQYVLMLEQALSEVAGKPIAVPYWDWTDPASVDSVFAPDFMGGDGDAAQGYEVTTGPFAQEQWPLRVHPYGPWYGPSKSDSITRRMAMPAFSLPTAEQVEAALGVPSYDVAPFDDRSGRSESFRNALEGFRKEPATPIGETGCAGGTINTIPRGGSLMHNAVHSWVGGALDGSNTRFGTLRNTQTSPNDPVFFLHHSQIDRIWAKWQERHGVDTYLPKTGTSPDLNRTGNNAEGDVLEPFDQVGVEVTPADVADIRELGYVYDDSAPAAGARRQNSRPGGGVPAWAMNCRL